MAIGIQTSASVDSVLLEVSGPEVLAGRPRRQSGRRSQGRANVDANVLPPAPSAEVEKPQKPAPAEPVTVPMPAAVLPPPAPVARRPVRGSSDPALCLDSVYDMHKRWKDLEVCYFVSPI